MSQQPTQPTHLQPPQTTNTLIFLQSVSGLGISLFSTIHLLTHTTVLYNLNFANNLLLGTRVLYQTPLIEPLLLGTLAVHAGCGAVRSYQRRQRRAERNFEKRGEKAVAREVHRYVGVFLTGGVLLHWYTVRYIYPFKYSYLPVLKLNGSSLVDYGLVTWFMKGRPLTTAFYVTLGVAGVTHTIFGTYYALQAMNTWRKQKYVAKKGNMEGWTVIPPNAVKGISFHRKLLIGCGVCSTVMVAGILFHLHQATLVLSETFYKIHIPLAFFYKSLLKSN